MKKFNPKPRITPHILALSRYNTTHTKKGPEVKDLKSRNQPCLELRDPIQARTKIKIPELKETPGKPTLSRNKRTNPSSN